MTLWARSDVISVSVGDAGHSHTRPIDKKATKALRAETGNPDAFVFSKEFTVDCDFCTKVLSSDPGWANNPDKIPLTYDEDLHKKKMEQEGTVLTQLMAQAMAQALAQQIGQNPDAVKAAASSLHVARPGARLAV
jgi:hypothetical protein